MAQSYGWKRCEVRINFLFVRLVALIGCMQIFPAIILESDALPLALYKPTSRESIYTTSCPVLLLANRLLKVLTSAWLSLSTR